MTTFFWFQNFFLSASSCFDFAIVIQNLRMLEQQQVEARRKLLESRQVKGKEIDVQKKQLLLLESKKFSNGQSRGELDKYRDFLSFASRKMGDRRLSSSDLDRSINDFHRRLDGATQSSKLIKVTEFMVESVLAAIKRKVHTLGLMKDKSSATLKNAIDKYERAKEKEQQLRSSIHSAQSEIQKWAKQNKSLSAEIAKLEIDKSVIQLKEEETQNELRVIRDETKAEEEKFALAKNAHLLEIDEAESQLTTLLEDAAAFECTMQSDKATYESEKTKLFDSMKQEGWKFQTNSVEAFKAAIQAEHANIERLFDTEMDNLSILEKEVKEMERRRTLIEIETREKDKESHAIDLQVDSIKTTEATRMAVAADIEKKVASGRAEIESIERKFDSFRIHAPTSRKSMFLFTHQQCRPDFSTGSLRAMEVVHRSEEEKNALTDSRMAAEQLELDNHLKMLLEELTACDQKSKADATHWEQIEMPSLQGRILSAQEQANHAEDSCKKLVEGEFPEKVEEMEDFNCRIVDLLHRR
jgi:hypothetical protein